MRRHQGALFALAAGALLLAVGQSDAAIVYPDGSSEIPLDDLPGTTPDGAIADPGIYAGAPPEVVTAPGADPVAAFLYMLRACEHNALDVASGACYSIVYGGGRFSDFSDHPYLTGEWAGMPLAASTCIAAGIESGNCISTAAGGYQINVPTLREIRAYAGDVEGFDPAAQDMLAELLLRKIGAMGAIQDGATEKAIQIAGGRWASLPGARGKQGQRSLAFAVNAYNQGLTA